MNVSVDNKSTTFGLKHRKWSNTSEITRLPDKLQISGKRQRILLLEIEKNESKKLKSFQKILEQISQSPQYNQCRQNQSSRGIVYEKNNQELDIAGNTGTIPK